MDNRDFKDKYVNPYTDFGFKKLFGTEINKDLLISFINSLLHGREVVKDLTYINESSPNSPKPPKLLSSPSWSTTVTKKA